MTYKQRKATLINVDTIANGNFTGVLCFDDGSDVHFTRVSDRVKHVLTHTGKYFIGRHHTYFVTDSGLLTYRERK